MKKTHKIVLIASASVFGVLLLLLAGFLFYVHSIIRDSDLSIASIEEYRARRETDACLPAVPEDEFAGYTEIDFRYEQHLSILSDERWYRMILSYDAAAYAEQTERIEKTYAFAASPGDPAAAGCAPDFRYGGFAFRTCADNYYPKSMRFIGWNEAEQKICYLYFEDGELDFTNDFPTFFKEHRFIAE